MRCVVRTAVATSHVSTTLAGNSLQPVGEAFEITHRHNRIAVLPCSSTPRAQAQVSTAGPLLLPLLPMGLAVGTAAAARAVTLYCVSLPRVQSHKARTA